MVWRFGGYGILCWCERSVIEKFKERMLDILGKLVVSIFLFLLGFMLGFCVIYVCCFCWISYMVVWLVGLDLLFFFV